MHGAGVISTDADVTDLTLQPVGTGQMADTFRVSVQYRPAAPVTPTAGRRRRPRSKSAELGFIVIGGQIARIPPEPQVDDRSGRTGLRRHESPCSRAASPLHVDVDASTNAPQHAVESVA